jgi:ABC-type transporter Mla maintaining outer membrane lipid asymmetry ATPase subunit MlaF
LAEQVILINKGKLSTFTSPEAIQQSEIPEIQSFIQSTMGKIYLSRETEERI